MIRLLSLLIAILIVHFSGGIATAQSEISSDVGVRTWITTGYTKWNFETPTIDPLSELRWRGTDVVVSEGHLDLVWRRLVLQLRLGGGHVNDGAFIDDDFLRTGYQARISYTRSAVEGYVFYGIGDVGFRVLEWHEAMAGNRGFIDIFVGYQYWKEKYEAFGAKGFQLPPICPLAVCSVGISDSILGITHTYSLHSVRLGARADIPLGAGFALRVNGAIVPFTRMEQEDIHHVNRNFLKDPSNRTRAEGGFGYEIDAALAYQFWRGLSVEAGYRFWRIDAGEGTVTQFLSNGRTPVTAGNVMIERGGPYVGVQYRF
jgi:hypothetical protein